MKVIRTPKLDRILPRIKLRDKKMYLSIPDDPEAWKWNFSEIELDDRPKLVHIGDSVTSGYYYRPALTFAKLLQEANPDFQVIDLSKVEFYFYSLPEFSNLIRELKPEKVLISVGYNFQMGESDELIQEDVYNNYAWILDYMEPGSVTVFLPQLTSHLAKIPSYQKLYENLKSTSIKLKVMMIDLNSIFHDDRYLFDLIHMKQEGLKLLSEHISGVKSSYKISKHAEVESLLNAFFSCFYRGYSDLCIKNLEELRTIMPDVDFKTLAMAIRDGIFTENGGLFSETTLEIYYKRIECVPVVPVTSTNHMHYPDQKLFKYLDQHAKEKLRAIQRDKINLLETKRSSESKHRSVTVPEIALSPSGVPFKGTFKAYFHAQEIKKGNSLIKLQIHLLSNDLIGKKVCLFLNSQRVFEAMITNILSKYEIPLRSTDISNYCDIQVQFLHDQNQIQSDAFRVEKLTLIRLPE